MSIEINSFWKKQLEIHKRIMRVPSRDEMWLDEKYIELLQVKFIRKKLIKNINEKKGNNKHI